MQLSVKCTAWEGLIFLHVGKGLDKFLTFLCMMWVSEQLQEKEPMKLDARMIFGHFHMNFEQTIHLYSLKRI